MCALAIRVMTRDEVDVAVEWAAREGWNPGRSDAAAFHAADPEGFMASVDEDGSLVASISAEQLDAFAAVFPEFPPERTVLSHNGYNHQVFRVLPGVLENRAEVLAGFTTQPPEGHGTPEPVA